MRRKTFIAGLLTATAMRATPAERKAGRFLRAPDGHDAGGGAAPAPSPAPSASEPSAEPAKPSNNAMDALEAEFGNVSFEEGNDEGKEPEAAKPEAKPGVSEPEPAGDPDPAEALETERLRANAAEEELRLLKAEKGKEPPKDDAKPETSQETDPAPKSDDYEFGEADSKYIADTARWNARQEFAQMRAKEALTAELNTIEDGYKTAVGSEEFKAEYPDFDEVVTKGAAEEKWECSPLMALAIKASPVGGHVAYELAKNPAEAARIAKLIPVEQAFELGQKVGQHAHRLAAKKEAPAAPAKVASSAPQPPANRSRGSGGQYASEQNAVHDRMLKEFR